VGTFGCRPVLYSVGLLFTASHVPRAIGQVVEGMQLKSVRCLCDQQSSIKEYEVFVSA
jgi:hypothetical protein